MVLRTSTAFGDVLEFSALQFGDDVIDVLGVRINRRLAWAASQRTVTFAVALIVIERHRRDAFALDVFPNVQLGPVQQRMNAHVGAWGEIRFELIPQFRRLIANIPRVVLIARAEVALFRAAAFFIAACSNNDAMPRFAIVVDVVFSRSKIEPTTHASALQGGFERTAFQQRAALLARHPARIIDRQMSGSGKGIPGSNGRLILANDHRQLVFLREAIAILDHLRQFVAGVDVDERKRNVAEERLAGEPQQHRRVFADRPQHAHAVEMAEGLAEDINALLFQQVEMIEGRGSQRQLQSMGVGHHWKNCHGARGVLGDFRRLSAMNNRRENLCGPVRASVPPRLNVRSRMLLFGWSLVQHAQANPAVVVVSRRHTAL